MAADALVGIVTASLLVWVIYGPWQMTCTDQARCRLFSLRDQVFDIAADGRLSFDSVEYQEVRTALNLMIRYSHRLTLFRLAAMLVVRSGRKAHAGSDIRQVIEAIEDVATRNEVQAIMANAMGVVFSMLVLKSPFLFVSYWIVACAFAVRRSVFHGKNSLFGEGYRIIRDKSGELMLSGTFCSDI
jgi:hypothetical protein